MANKSMKKLVVLVICAVTLAHQAIAQDVVKTVLAYPTGDPASSGLLVDKSAPAEVMFNQKYEYSLEALNKTKSVLFEVLIQEALPEGFKIQGTTPKAEIKDQVVTWRFDSLSPGTRQKLTVTGVPTSVGDFISCTSATYSLHACVLTKVLQPDLKLTISSPSVVLQCDPIIEQYEITNKGSGTTQNVVINHALPSGLTTFDGSRSVVFNLDRLEPGKTVSFRKLLKADRTGEFASQAVATADGGLTSTARTATKVVSPKLTVDVSGSKTVFLGRKVTYLIKVTNTGDGNANDVALTSNIPSDVIIDSIANNGRRVGNQVVWDTLGSLKPNESVTASITILPSQRGVVDLGAMASATCATQMQDWAKTLIEGIPAILLEVVDLSDPVAVGDDVTYVVRVTNQGTADGTNIRITAVLEDAMRYVSSTGATSARVSGNTVTFNPLANLSPKKVATWELKIKAVKSGDIRFRVKLESDQMTRSVDETEATNFYQ